MRVSVSRESICAHTPALFPDAELQEDRPKNLLHINPARQPPQMMGGNAQLLCGQLGIEIMVNKTFQSVPG